MSTYLGRPVRRRRSDPLAILLLLIPLAGIPALGYVAYKVVFSQQPPKPVAQAPKPKAPPPKPPEPVAVTPPPKTFDEPLQPTTGRVSTIPAAVDRVTSELQAALELPKKVLVVWLLDQSASAENHRREVIARMETMYRHLAAAAKDAHSAEPGDGPPVLSAVVAYGPKVNVLTETPVADEAELVEAVNKVSADESSVENTFAALQETADKFLPFFKQRFVVFVVVSDEAGDDETKIDAVLPVLVRRQVRVNVIGQSATFGSIDGGQKGLETPAAEGHIALRHGPESREPEWIHLDYPSGYGSGEENVDTEMGPYSLQRLCDQTGGTYFAIPASGGRWAAASGNMRRYAPAYVSEAEYQQRLASNKALKALVDAARLPRAEVVLGRGLSLDNSDENAVRRTRELDDAMKPVARSRPGIDKLYDTLKAGEADAAKLSEPRLKAGFDLAYGRALAAKARADGYIEMCGQMKAGRKFQNPDSKVWNLEPGDVATGVSAVDKMAAKAKDLLKRVIDQHPGTPWAAAAQRELSATIGYRWVER